MTAPLALPSATGSPTALARKRGTLPLAALAGGIATLMVFAGLIAAYLAMRTNVDEWPPENATFDYYLGTTLVITVLLGSVTVEWAHTAIRNGYRGHALVAYGITFGLGIAYLNGVYYRLGELEYAAGEHAYGVVTHALYVLAFAVGLAAIGTIVLTFLKAAGHQLTALNSEISRATAIVWHTAALAWIAAYYPIFITK